MPNASRSNELNPADIISSESNVNLCEESPHLTRSLRRLHPPPPTRHLTSPSPPHNPPQTDRLYAIIPWVSKAVLLSMMRKEQGRLTRANHVVLGQALLLYALTALVLLLVSLPRRHVSWKRVRQIDLLVHTYIIGVAHPLTAYFVDLSFPPTLLGYSILTPSWQGIVRFHGQSFGTAVVNLW
jgi:hypothetical protein